MFIPNVAVVSKTNYTITNSSGNFDLNLFSSKDSVSFQHVAYHRKVVPYSLLLRANKVFLATREIRQKEVNVVGQKNIQEKIVAKEVILIDKKISTVYSNAGDILRKKSSVFVKDYGGETGLKTVSARGMSSENTIVLFNEARVNDLRTGSFDFSTLGSLSLDKIEFVKSTDNDNQYSSIGGVIKMQSGNLSSDKGLTAGMKYSSANLKSFYSNYKGVNSALTYNINFERTYSPNNFSYEFEGMKLRRKNSFFSKTFASGDLTYKNSSAIIDFYTHYSHLHNGIPGFVVSNNTESSVATNNTDGVLSVLNGKIELAEDLYLNGITSYHYQDLTIKDTGGLLLLNTNQQNSKLNDFSGTVKINYQKTIFDLAFGYELTTGKITKVGTYLAGVDAPQNISRTSGKVFGNSKISFKDLSILSDAIFSAGINKQFIKEKLGQTNEAESISYSVSALFIPKLSSNVSLLLSYIDNYRIPTFNERYYSTIFSNTSLKPEKYKGYDAQLSYSFDIAGNTNISATYFLIEGRDKIQWVPTRMALQIPRNVAKVTSEGFELRVEKSLFNDLLNLNGNLVYTEARNKSAQNKTDKSYNKQLVYTPKIRFAFDTHLHLDSFTFSLFGNYSGKTYFTADNTEQNSLSRYMTIDLSASYEFKLLKKSNTITLSLYNAFNENYFVIQSYPMPLRTLQINYQVKIL